MSFQNLLDRKKRESRAFSIMDSDSTLLSHILMAANKRESRAFSIMDTDSPLAGGLLGARANMSSSDDPEFDNQRKSMFARRQTMRQSMVSNSSRLDRQVQIGRSIFYLYLGSGFSKRSKQLRNARR